MALEDPGSDRRSWTVRTAETRQVDPSSEPTVSSGPVDPLSRAAPSGNHIALPVGTELHEYTLESVLGSGGFGITYLARDNNLQCRVAIKEYLPNDLAVRSDGSTVCARTDSDTHGYKVGLERFLAETRVLASFRHPNIVRVTRFFEANNTAYMVMDFERGEPLREWLKQQGPVDEALLLRMFLPLLEGLEVVHKTGVLHRDIKPANIYVRENDGSLVLLDFGAARDASGGTSRSLTSIVTPGYAPFEQYHTHGAQGPWSDLYAFGGVLYWLVTGNKPVEAPSRVRDDSMPSAETAAAGRYSSALLRAIDWALTPDERDRPKCVAEFKAALTGQVEVSGREFVPRAAPAPPAGIASRKASTTRIVEIYAVGVVVAALVAVAGYAILTPRAPTPPAAASPQTSVAAIPAADPAAGSTGVPRANQPEKGADAGRGAVPRNRAAAVSKGVAPKEAAIAAAPVLATEAPASAEARASRADDPVAYLVFDVAPRGEVVVDGRKVGTAPPLSKLKLAPGKHKIEVHGSMPPYIYYYTVRLDANENKRVWAKFANEGY